MTGHDSQPALDALGDRLEGAAARAVSAGGVAPGGSRRSRLILVPVLAIFALVALGVAMLVPGGGGSAEAAVQAAAQQTVDESTGQFEITVSVSDVADLPDLDLVMQGAYDIPNERFQTTLDLSSALSGLGGEAVEWFGGDTTFTVVVEGDTVYLRVPMLSSLTGTGAEWVKMTMSEMAEQGDPFGQGDQTYGQGTLDPSAFLDALEGFGGEVTEVGRESLRGVDTTHYQGTVDLQQLYAEIPAEERAELEAQLGQLLPGDLSLPVLPVDVWVDDADHVRKVSVRLDLADVDGAALGLPATEPLAGTVEVSIEYFAIGEPIEITVPADEQATDLDEVLDGFGLGLLEDLDLDGFDMEGLEDFGMEGLEGFGLDSESLEQMTEELEGLFGEDGLGGFDSESLDGMVEELEGLFGDVDPGQPDEESGPAPAPEPLPVPDPAPGPQVDAAEPQEA